jgi:hypothetical protein
MFLKVRQHMLKNSEHYSNISIILCSLLHHKLSCVFRMDLTFLRVLYTEVDYLHTYCWLFVIYLYVELGQHIANILMSVPLPTSMVTYLMLPKFLVSGFWFEYQFFINRLLFPMSEMWHCPHTLYLVYLAIYWGAVFC